MRLPPTHASHNRAPEPDASTSAAPTEEPGQDATASIGATANLATTSASGNVIASQASAGPVTASNSANAGTPGASCSHSSTVAQQLGVSPALSATGDLQPQPAASSTLPQPAQNSTEDDDDDDDYACINYSILCA